MKSSPQTADDTPYRPDIDGLRAIAVTAVIIYHGFPHVLAGGFVGVDVFFVISGFLISANIFRRIDAGHFGFADFYGRRIRRIFPSLLVILLACLGYGFVVLLPSELALLGRDIAGGAGFVSNLLLWHEAGYFDRASIAKPLLHLWSLGVEEQFYIVWPVALWLVYRRRRSSPAFRRCSSPAFWRRSGPAPGRSRSPLFLIIAWIVSLAASLAIVAHHETADFYSPITRLWELDSGAILAWITLYAPHRLRRIVPAPARSHHADLASALGLALIVGSAGLIDRTMHFPGGLALLPVAGAVILIATGPHALINRTVLTNKVAVFIGLISYPLYLWHWPLISFASIIDHGRPLKAFLVLCLIGASVLLGWLTYRLVERPLRFGPNRRRNTLLLATLMAAAGLAGITTWRAHGFPGRYGAMPHLSVANINVAIGDGIFQPTQAMHTSKIDGITVSRIGSGRAAVLFTGDSVIYQYGPRVQELLDRGRLRETVYFVAGPSCAPVPGVIRAGLFAVCNNLQRVAANLIAAKNIKTIVLGASWAGYQIPAIRIARAGTTAPMNTKTGIRDFYANLEQEVRQLVSAGHKVYLVLAPVADPRFDPSRMVTRSPFGFHIDRKLLNGVPIDTLLTATAPTNRRLAAIAAATGAKTLDPLADVCPATPNCPVFFDHGKPKFADSLHLRPAFVAHHIKIFDRLLTR